MVFNLGQFRTTYPAEISGFARLRLDCEQLGNCPLILRAQEFSNGN